jgi:hypothetical protein
MGRVLFIFLDGVGIGRPDPDTNPFLQSRLPTLQGLLGGELPHLDRPEATHGECMAFPLDARLGVKGLPQSGTGHTSLLTGENGPALYGRHFGPWVPVRLRPVVEKRNFLTRALARGYRCVFANAYPKEYADSPWARRPAGPPLAAMASGLLTRDAGALARGEAVSSEIVNSAWRTRLGYENILEITPQEAGRNLGRLSGQADLTFFAHYGTDYAGHRGRMPGSVRALERVDAFLEGVLEASPGDTLIVLTSDHGNIENVLGGHTLNPVLTLLRGPGAPELREGLRSITDIPHLILSSLSRDGRRSGA